MILSDIKEKDALVAILAAILSLQLRKDRNPMWAEASVSDAMKLLEAVNAEKETA